MRHRPALLFFFGSIATASVVAACVGDEPSSGGDTSDASTTSDGSSSDGASPGDAAGGCTGTQTLCGTSCVDLNTDDNNCGRCSHSCKGDGCDKGACKPTDLLTGLDSPTGLATSNATDQVVVNAGGALHICAKAGCANVSHALFGTSGPITHRDSPLCVFGGVGSGEEYGTIVYSGTTPYYSANTLTPGSGAPATFGEPTGLGIGSVHCGGSHEASGHGDLALNADYSVVNLHDGISTLAEQYVTEYGERFVAVQAGDPGYIVFTVENGNVDYCARGAADAGLCTPQKLVQNDPSPAITSTSGRLVVTSTMAYWTTQEEANMSKLRIWGCPMPGGCTDAKLLVDGESGIDAFVADDKGLYWVDALGSRVRACLDTTNGCGATGAVTVLDNLAAPSGIAIDDTYLFVTQTGADAGQGKVTRLVR